MSEVVTAKVFELAERMKEIENALLLNSQGLNQRLQTVEQGLAAVRQEQASEKQAARETARADELATLKAEIEALTKERDVFKAKADERTIAAVAKEIAGK